MSDQMELARAVERLEELHPNEVLEWAVEKYGEGLTLSISFGNAEGIVLLDMLARITKKVRIFTLDTGFLFEETQQFREDVVQRYRLPLETFHPQLSVREQADRFGEALYSRQPDLCCHMRKVEPQRRALHGYKAWVTGIRRDQTPYRAGTPVVSWDERFQVAKVSPLALWSEEQVHDYAQEHEVPLNPLLKRGYRSIGCEPCTRPVADGEELRAGRWPSLEKTECGMHVAEGAVHGAR